LNCADAGAVEQAYRTAGERDAALRPPGSFSPRRSPEHAASREIEME